MNKQEAVRVLQERVRAIPSSNNTTSIVLFEKREDGTVFVSYRYQREKIAVELIAMNLTGTLMKVWDGHFMYKRTLDGDVEMVITCYGMCPSPRGLLEAIEKVEIKRRGEEFADKKNVLPVALRIRQEDRNSLPALAKIIAVDPQKGYVIVASDDIYQARGASYEIIREKVLELQKHFKDNWIEDTVLVTRIPKEKGESSSRTGKTLRFNQVYAPNPIADYAEWVLEIQGENVRNSPSQALLRMVLTDPNCIHSHKARQTFQMNGSTEIDMLSKLLLPFRTC